MVTLHINDLRGNLGCDNKPSKLFPDAAVNNVTQRSGILSSRMTAEKCAQMCFEYPNCDSFTFDPFYPEESMCFMFSGGVLTPSKEGQISAWCPKGISNHVCSPSYLFIIFARRITSK